MRFSFTVFKTCNCSLVVTLTQRHIYALLHKHSHTKSNTHTLSLSHTHTHTHTHTFWLLASWSEKLTRGSKIVALVMQITGLSSLKNVTHSLTHTHNKNSLTQIFARWQEQVCPSFNVYLVGIIGSVEPSQAFLGFYKIFEEL
jgi:hypothetical protein